MKTPRLDNHCGGLCPMPEQSCPPGPCKCRDGAKIGDTSVPGYLRRMRELGHRVLAKDVRRTMKKNRRP